MKRIIENNVAIILTTIVFVLVLSSCGSTYQACPAYMNSVNPTYGSCSR